MFLGNKACSVRVPGLRTLTRETAPMFNNAATLRRYVARLSENVTVLQFVRKIGVRYLWVST